MDLQFWYWWILGFALLIAELLLPTGFVLVWIGAGALIVGLLAFLLPLGWELQLMLFGITSIASFFVWNRYKPATKDSDQPTLNRRGHSYVGRAFTLTTPIVNGVGKLHVDDSQWRITGPDAAAGTQVRVTAADGNTLKVELG